MQRKIDKEIEEIKQAIVYMEQKIIEESIRLTQLLLDANEEIKKREREQNFIEYFNQIFQGDEDNELSDFFGIDDREDEDSGIDLSSEEQIKDIEDLFKKFMDERDDKKEDK